MEEMDIDDKDDKDYYEKHKRILHHDHHTGKYISHVCAKCNHKMKDKKLLPVIFHNGRGYDWQFLIKILAKDKELSMKIIPQSMEKFISFSVFMRIKKGKQIQKMKYNSQLRRKQKVFLTDNGVETFFRTNNPFMVDQYGLMEIRFIDSMQFFNNESLESLVNSLKMQTSFEYKSYDILKKDFGHFFKFLKGRYKNDDIL